jgi:hypothetical protein
MLCPGQGAFARQYVAVTEFSQFDSIIGDDELMFRVYFLCVKNRHFLRVENILARADFAHRRER